MRLRALLLAACLPAAFGTAPATALDDAVASECTYVYKSLASSVDHVLVMIVAEAHASGALPALTTTVSCVVENAYHETFRVDATSAGPHVYTTGSSVFRWDTPTVCADSTALFPRADASTYTVHEDSHCVNGDD